MIGGFSVLEIEYFFYKKYKSLMDSSQLIQRTKIFALEIIKFFQSLPKTEEAGILGKQ